MEEIRQPSTIAYILCILNLQMYTISSMGLLIVHFLYLLFVYVHVGVSNLSTTRCRLVFTDMGPTSKCRNTYMYIIHIRSWEIISGFPTLSWSKPAHARFDLFLSLTLALSTCPNVPLLSVSQCSSPLCVPMFLSSVCVPMFLSSVSQSSSPLCVSQCSSPLYVW